MLPFGNGKIREATVVMIRELSCSPLTKIKVGKLREISKVILWSIIIVLTYFPPGTTVEACQRLE